MGTKIEALVKFRLIFKLRQKNAGNFRLTIADASAAYAVRCVQLACLVIGYSVIRLHRNQEATMALTSAEKQQRYRERHLGIHGTKERIQFFISVQTRAQLGRLARHYGYAVTKVIEDLAADAERALLSKLPPHQHKAGLGPPSKRRRRRSRPHRKVTA
jgi:hypothetical protein